MEVCVMLQQFQLWNLKVLRLLFFCNLKKNVYFQFFLLFYIIISTFWWWRPLIKPDFSMIFVSQFVFDRIDRIYYNWIYLSLLSYLFIALFIAVYGIVKNHLGKTNQCNWFSDCPVNNTIWPSWCTGVINTNNVLTLKVQ